MDFIIQNLIPYLVLYKYVAIFFIAFVAAFIVPIPSGSILMAAGAYTSIGYFNIYLVIFLSIVGNILGDNFGYFMARRYGREVLSRIGFRSVLNSNNFNEIENKFNKHPGFIIFISRFEVLSTLSVNLLSGISKTNYKKYLLHESIGTLVQVLMYFFIGYLFADKWESINTMIGRMTLVGVFVFLLIIIFFAKKTINNRFT